MQKCIYGACRLNLHNVNARLSWSLCCGFADICVTSCTEQSVPWQSVIDRSRLSDVRWASHRISISCLLSCALM